LPGLDWGEFEIEAGFGVLIGVSWSGHGVILAGFAGSAELASQSPQVLQAHGVGSGRSNCRQLVPWFL
jgi:hypothetical protein